jgi:hypothetical protein
VNAGLIQAIFYGLTRLAASGGGVYCLTEKQWWLGGGLLAGSAGFTLYDKFKVNAQVQSALQTQPPSK